MMVRTDRTDYAPMEAWDVEVGDVLSVLPSGCVQPSSLLVSKVIHGPLAEDSECRVLCQFWCGGTKVLTKPDQLMLVYREGLGDGA